MDVLSAVAAKIWACLTSIFPALAGVGVSLHVDTKKTADLSNKQLAATFFCGVSTAYFFSHFASEHWSIDPLSYTFMLIQFSVAALGMSIMAQLVVTVPEQIPKIFDAIRTKYFGG